MEIEKSAKELKSLAKVVARIDLKSLFLLNSYVRRSLDALEHERVAAEINVEGTLFEEKEDCLIAKAVFSFVGTATDENNVKNEKEAVSIGAEYILEYSLPEKTGLTKEELENFCDINAVYNAWPYWRELVQSLSNKMGLPPITLPLLKFRQPKKHSRKEDAKNERTDTRSL